MKTKRISRNDAMAMRGKDAGNDAQFMRRIRIGRRWATVIDHYCQVAGRYSGHVHVDGDPCNVSRVATWE